MLWLRVNGIDGVLRVATALSVAGAGLGFSLIGVGGTAFADSSEVNGSGVIGVSPARTVVQFAPNAVSVTFSTPLRKSGASMRIMTPSGDVGDGSVSTSARTLRRGLVIGAPNGVYTVDWAAVTQDGKKLSGTFGFTAGHPNNDPLITGEAVTATADAGSPPTSSASSAPSPTETIPTQEKSLKKDPWADDGDSLAVPASKHDEPPSGGGASYGFPLIAMALGALLVIASGLVSRRHRTSDPERLTIRTRSGIYSV